MIEWYNHYMTHFPDWYKVVSIMLLMPMGYTFFWGISDLPRFGSSYYALNAAKGLVGFVLCMFFLWPIPIAIFLARLPGRWNMSEFDEVLAYERKKGIIDD